MQIGKVKDDNCSSIQNAHLEPVLFPSTEIENTSTKIQVLSAKLTLPEKNLRVFTLKAECLSLHILEFTFTLLSLFIKGITL